MDLHEILKKYNTEQECVNYLKLLRWKGKTECTYCFSTRVYERNGSCRFKCRDCNRSFSVTVGTIFHNSKIPLTKWFLAISIVIAAKKGISSRQLARTINVNKDTAWYMQYRIRLAMKEDVLLQGLVEVDETYIGGALGNMSPEKKEKRNPFRSGMVHKMPVLGMMERNKGKVGLFCIDRANMKTIQPIMKEVINSKSKIVTDGFGGYYGVGKHFNKHIRINAEKKQRAWGRYHVNNIEGFFSIIKRAIIGQYHHLSREHLQSYMDEIAFKKNHRNESGFNLLLTKACAVK